MNDSIIEWKKYLKTEGLLKGNISNSNIDFAFKIAMQNLEDSITKFVPSIKGMIWNGFCPKASINDVKESLSLLKLASTKIGQADFDSLGPPGPDQISTIFNQMFISQEDSKLDEHTPGENQNQGRWQNDIVENKNIRNIENIEKFKTNTDIDKRMKSLTKLIDTIKK